MNPKKRGQSLVEFALILPILLFIFFMIIDGAFIVQGYLAVNHAAREAARFATTYQPPQEECFDHDKDGIPNNDGYPWCPSNPHESDEEYYNRRVQMIKLVAQEASRGLRIEDVCFNESCMSSNQAEPGMWGVRVWGFQEFDKPEVLDKPGLQGLPVRVQVVHNVPLVVFSVFSSKAQMPVSASTEMINEGPNVSQNGALPPTFQPLPTPVPPTAGAPTVTVDPTDVGGPTPTPTPYPEYDIALNFQVATNILPEDREHIVVAHVTDPQGGDVAGARVTFRTDEGSFDYSGTTLKSVIVSTGADGRARVPIYANEPAEAHIEAWLDYDLDGIIDVTNPSEPSDTATKIWEITPNTPYLIVTNHYPEPQEWIAVDMMDHLTAQNPHSLWWCPATLTSTQVIAQLATGLNVDAGTGDLLDVAAQVPIGVVGLYRLETHQGTGGSNGCQENSSLVARSALIKIKEVPSDLTITDVTIVTAPEDRATGRPLTIALTIENLAPVPVAGGPFDVDIYMNMDEAPTVGRLGSSKQWIETLDPQATQVLTVVVMPEIFGENNLWAQVDSTNYVEESDEDNNVYGPIDFTAECGVFDEARSDNFDAGLKSVWQSEGIGSSSTGSTNVNGSGQLEITSLGTKLGGSDSFYYVYQKYEGDFDARLRIFGVPETNSYAKIGLHIRESPLVNAPFAHAGLNHERTPAARQNLYRATPGTGSSGVGSRPKVDLPYWTRIVRQGNSYSMYESTVAEPAYNDWSLVGKVDINRNLPMIGIANASYKSTTFGTGTVDDFRICTEDGNGGGQIKPPGLIECSELIHIPGFEGNPATVFEYWRAGSVDPVSFRRTSEQFRSGSFSMALYASLGYYPCNESNLNPYLYQEVQLPTDVYSNSTLVVKGSYFINKSSFSCSIGGPDADDDLSIQLQNLDGSSITPPQVIKDGGATPKVWHTVPITLSDGVNLESYGGERVRLYWNGTHDGDFDGTFFYVDDVSAQLCTVWPIPDPIPGTGTFGGSVSTLGEYNIPVSLTGADIRAYAQGGQVYHTRSIHDGSYRFYNIPAGNYLVYAEAWVSGQLRTAVTSIVVVADDPDPNLSLNLLLQ